MRGDDGSGSVLAVAIVAAMLAVTGLSLPLYATSVVRQSAILAADAAALAAADAASGAVAGYPCARAEQAAALNGAELTGCDVDGLVVTVDVRRFYLAFDIDDARSRAGPPAQHPASQEQGPAS